MKWNLFRSAMEMILNCTSICLARTVALESFCFAGLPRARETRIGSFWRAASAPIKLVPILWKIVDNIVDKDNSLWPYVPNKSGVIAEAADRVAVMYAGRLIEVGPVEQVLHASHHPYTRGLMASIPALAARVERLNQIDGSVSRLDAIPDGRATSCANCRTNLA